LLFWQPQWFLPPFVWVLVEEEEEEEEEEEG